ncbi:Acg family FMN-binding oxidoreductase [Gimesia aquarii]|uniref:NAD(P)H nitroreductase n=1 Tax=Gimesia aquarii TaxID=2527964 RepID=A0A517VU32_9PLAN|nr:hypothetical protein [Gimesia aquarii]QDT96490.1 Putative NAD(P)H nitroreductase [Gimesia aquarii]
MPLEERFSCWKVVEEDYPAEASLTERLRFLIRYAILAPSSHNTEPWLYRIHDDQIDLFYDESRWLKVADSDQRELHISVGCALENLLIAAEHFGLEHQVSFLPGNDEPSLCANVTFREQEKRAPYRPDELFSMIPVRHTNHGQCEDREIPGDLLQQLQDTCVEDSLMLHLTADDEIKQKVDELVVRGDAIEFSDPAFREELAQWVGQGVFGTGWLMSKIAKLAVCYIDMGNTQAKKDSEVLMSSPILGLISSKTDDRMSQLQVGQVYERLSLLAALHGIWCQPMSQIVQVPELKSELATLIPQQGLTPQHPFRIGYAPAEKHHTPRRPFKEVLV